MRQIKIYDWTGQILYQGDVKSKDVDKVLEANRCKCYDNEPTDKNGQDADCKECDDTGYIGDFEIVWSDKSCKDNVYDFIDY